MLGSYLPHKRSDERITTFRHDIPLANFQLTITKLSQINNSPNQQANHPIIKLTDKKLRRQYSYLSEQQRRRPPGNELKSV